MKLLTVLSLLTMNYLFTFEWPLQKHLWNLSLEIAKFKFWWKLKEQSDWNWLAMFFFFKNWYLINLNNFIKYLVGRETCGRKFKVHVLRNEKKDALLNGSCLKHLSSDALVKKKAFKKLFKWFIYWFMHALNTFVENLDDQKVLKRQLDRYGSIDIDRSCIQFNFCNVYFACISNLKK